MIKRNVISKIICTFAVEIIIVVTIKNDHLAFANLTISFGTAIANAKVILGVSDNSGHLWTK
ncbi:MAG: hypothetical protein KBS47_02195 [Bacteroidales bacterium]|nr:hypothetical protein [Candidatus Equimonas enterica]